jgi:hypothetical protein
MKFGKKKNEEESGIFLITDKKDSNKGLCLEPTHIYTVIALENSFHVYSSLKKTFLYIV